ncbi:hypothetical protein AGMMS49992_30490 [Clostridia bacterium]|nr:hypothetical protein AGMMS49992_30490 [Clostridia bacterium]
MDAELKAQLEKIRSSGQTSMFDLVRVQRIAYRRKYYRLVNWLAEHKTEYTRFILTGEEPSDESG